MTEVKSAEFDKTPPWLALVCPCCGRRLANTSRAVWALCRCTRAPLLPEDLLGGCAPRVDEIEWEVREWRR